MGQGQQRRRVLSREEQRLSYLFLRGEPSLACSCLGHQLFSHYERQTRVTAADGAEVQQNSEGFGPRSTALGKRTPSRVLCPWPESPRVRTTPRFYDTQAVAEASCAPQRPRELHPLSCLPVTSLSGLSLELCPSQPAPPSSRPLPTPAQQLRVLRRAPTLVLDGLLGGGQLGLGLQLHPGQRCSRRHLRFIGWSLTRLRRRFGFRLLLGDPGQDGAAELRRRRAPRPHSCPRRCTETTTALQPRRPGRGHGHVMAITAPVSPGRQPGNRLSRCSSIAAR